MITYLLNFTLCSALLLLAYVALLKNKALYTFNRFYLLFAVVFSLTVPLIVIHQQTPAILKTDSPQVIMPNVPVFIPLDATPGEATNTFNYIPYVLLSAYLLITGVLSVRYINNLCVIYKSIDKNNIVVHNGVKMVLINPKQTPHTFLNFIFLNKNESEQGQIDEAILHHEWPTPNSCIQLM